jgi:hypothetical protein
VLQSVPSIPPLLIANITDLTAAGTTSTTDADHAEADRVTTVAAKATADAHNAAVIEVDRRVAEADRLAAEATRAR